ncbi:MAG: large conductance mechanosensitive channel protein MscL, partial [Saprospiraceae bacterium]
MFKEFKSFIMRGNVVDLAIAVIIGGAFGAIVSSLVDDIITPLLLAPAIEAAGAKNIAELTWGAVKYGNFLSAIIKFIVIAFVLFLIVKAMN